MALLTAEHESWTRDPLRLRSVRRFGWLFLLLIIGLPAIEGREDSAGEYELKGAFLYKFARFIEWPPPASGEPLCIGIVGQDPFGPMLEQIVQGRLVNGQGIIVRRYRSGQAIEGCRIVFISTSERKRLRETLQKVSGPGVLTIGEVPGFCQIGGVINFEIVSDSVRFEINIDAAERARLQVSSKLLSLAKVVREKGQ